MLDLTGFNIKQAEYLGQIELDPHSVYKERTWRIDAVLSFCLIVLHCHPTPMLA